MLSNSGLHFHIFIAQLWFQEQKVPLIQAPAHKVLVDNLHVQPRSDVLANWMTLWIWKSPLSSLEMGDFSRNWHYDASVKLGTLKQEKSLENANFKIN